jgi:uncharacterized membrane protein
MARHPKLVRVVGDRVDGVVSARPTNFAANPAAGEITVSIEIFLMILGAAIVHATWNAFVKSDEDRLGLMTMLFRTQFGISICLIPFVSVPAPESWPYLVTSAILNVGYMLFLNWAYQIGDLSHVYPFARGVARAIVAVVSVGFLGDHLNHLGQIAVVLITLGVTSLALDARDGWSLRPASGPSRTRHGLFHRRLYGHRRIRRPVCWNPPWLHGLAFTPLGNSDVGCCPRASTRKAHSCQRAEPASRSARWAHELRVVMARHLGVDSRADGPGVGAP